jgi:hypothetical protein
VHVAGDHRQHPPPRGACVLDSVGEILVAPISRVGVEVATPRCVGLCSEAARPVMRQENQMPRLRAIDQRLEQRAALVG